MTRATDEHQRALDPSSKAYPAAPLEGRRKCLISQ
jgi:hypothetical protein